MSSIDKGLHWLAGCMGWRDDLVTSIHEDEHGLGLWTAEAENLLGVINSMFLILPGSSRKFEVLLCRPLCVCWKLVKGPRSSLEKFVCCDITLSLEPLRESLFSTKYAKPPFELPLRLCFWDGTFDGAFSFSFRKVSSFVKSLVDFLCFNDTALSLHVLSSVECELWRAW